MHSPLRSSSAMRVPVVALLLMAVSFTANAAQIGIVALGASNTGGYGVGPEKAFPAKLEALMKAKGYDVQMKNAGAYGDTTAGMLGRLQSFVPDGTKLVILQPGSNDARQGVSAEKREANIQEIIKRLAARGVTTVRVDKVESGQAFPKQYLQSDGIHMTEQGHAMLANKLLQPVMGALGAPIR
jgi:acyl-CoA thioesterase I